MLVHELFPEGLIDTTLDLLQVTTTTEAEFVEIVVDTFKQVHGGFVVEDDQIVRVSYNDRMYLVVNIPTLIAQRQRWGEA